MPKLNHIEIERPTDEFAIITINRPEVLNAINVDLSQNYLLQSILSQQTIV